MCGRFKKKQSDVKKKRAPEETKKLLAGNLNPEPCTLNP